MARFILLVFLIQGLAVSALFAQTTQVKGTVYDNAGNPVPGVSVTVKNATQATMTGDDGRYSINVSSGDG